MSVSELNATKHYTIPSQLFAGSDSVREERPFTKEETEELERLWNMKEYFFSSSSF